MNFLDMIKAPAEAPIKAVRAMSGEDVYNNPRANDAWRNVAKGHIFDAETWKGLARGSHEDAFGPEIGEKWDNQVARTTGGLRVDQEKQLGANPGMSLEEIEYQKLLDAWMNKSMTGAYNG
jgi:hypothetical protein